MGCQRTISIVAGLLVTIITHISAQTSNSAQDNIAADNVELTRCGDEVQLSMDIAFGHVRPDSRQMLILTPRLISDADSIDLPSVGVYGSQPWYHYIRGGLSILQGRDHIKLHGKHCPQSLIYIKAVGYRPWMDKARLKLILSDVRCCNENDNEWVQQELSPRGTEPHIALQPPISEERIYSKRQRANINFIVNRTEILPNYKDNARELDKIRASIDSIRNDTTATARHITFKGYASPEDTWQHNTQLARGRTENLKQYVANEYDVPEELISTDFQPEDWEGFREYVVAHHDAKELPHADGILELIDTPMDPDRKLARIQAMFPAEYRYLLKNCFPALRRSEYTIEYTRRENIERQDERRDTTYQLPLGSLMQMEYEQPRPFRPLLALKTNLLSDLILWGNAEAEVPLGVESRWSVMAEWGSPWFVWHHNSRAYEIVQAGLELRYWAWPRCAPCRPTLTGTFVGIYCNSGKYDLEWKSKGDQGEFVHAGITLGHSWLLSKHWNLELSLGLGTLWGPRRHYVGQFSDTHLIWQYTSNTFYVGPTKLKLSIACLIGHKKPKNRKEGRP